MNEVYIVSAVRTAIGTFGGSLKDIPPSELASRVTAEAVRAHLSDIVRGEIVRYELPQLGALQFVCAHALAGGVTTSLALDAHGKALSYALLQMEI